MDLRDTLDWSRKWVVDFNDGKTQLVSFDWSNNTGAIAVKIGDSVLEEKSSFNMLGLTFSSKLDWGSHIFSIARTASKKIEALVRSISFFLLRLLYISINLPCGHAWNTVVMSGQVLLLATSNCWMRYKNGYAGLLVLHLLPLLNPLLIVEMWPAWVFSIGITLVDIRLNWLNWFDFLLLEGDLLVFLIDSMIFLTTFLDVTRMSMSSFFSSHN